MVSVLSMSACHEINVFVCENRVLKSVKEKFLSSACVRRFTQMCRFMGKEVREISCFFLLRRRARSCLPPPSERHAPPHYSKIHPSKYFSAKGPYLNDVRSGRGVRKKRT